VFVKRRFCKNPNRDWLFSVLFYRQKNSLIGSSLQEQQACPQFIDFLSTWLYYYIGIIIKHFYENRNKASTIRHYSNSNPEKGITFYFAIKLPPPQYERVIIARNQKGQIVRSVPV
jgi:hypothetical protein